MKEYYMTDEFLGNTDYKSIHDEWNRDRFSIISTGDAWWFWDRGLTARTYRLIVKEMARLYPNMVHII